MSTFTGGSRNGGIVLDVLIPGSVEESGVIVEKTDSANDAIDINGDSPEAIAVWIARYDDLLALPKSEEAAEELDRILAARKAKHKELWNEHNRKIEGCSRNSTLLFLATPHLRVVLDIPRSVRLSGGSSRHDGAISMGGSLHQKM